MPAQAIPYSPVAAAPARALTQQQAWFYSAFEAQQKDELLGFLLAFFFGIFGLHHFYLGRTGLGILYCVFFWTGIPALAGFIESFFMPGRVRRYNWDLQTYLLASMQLAPAYPAVSGVVTPTGPATPMNAALALPVPSCPACSGPMVAGAQFCAHCGASAQ